MHPMLTTAVKAARRAGNVITRGARDLDLLTVTAKGPKDFVSEVDRAAEAAIVETLLGAYPDHAIHAEEGTERGRNPDAEHVWIIDPLDGTTNFLHGFPQFAVSVACRHRGRAEVGVVFDPLRGELFTAERGGGTQLDGRRLRVSSRPGLEGALVGTGFPYRENRRWLKSYMAMLEAVMQATAGVRRPGAASLDLAYVAAGRLDAFWEFGLSPWDTAAGTLLITEAGGRVANLAGGEYVDGGQLLVGSPKVFAALTELLAPHLDDELRK
jgi:myo-inositol-1(or 4)-monophosphatase